MDSIDEMRVQDRVHWMCSQAKGECVLDIGCGSGSASILLGREGLTVTGVDARPEAVDAAQAALTHEEPEVQSRVEFRLMDAASLDFPDQSFDSVLIGEVIEYTVLPERLLAEARRVLRPGGVAVLTTPLGLTERETQRQVFYPYPLVRAIARHFEILEAFVDRRFFRIVAGTDGIHGIDPLAVADRLSSEAHHYLIGMQRRSVELAEELRVSEKNRKRVESDVTSLRAEVHFLENEVGSLRGELTTRDVANAELHATNNTQEVRLAQISRQLSRQTSRMHKLERERSRLAHRLAVADWKIRAIRNRKWWRLGVLLRDALHRPRRFLLMPFDVVRLVVSKSTPERRPEAPNQTPALQSSTPTQPPFQQSNSRPIEIPELVWPQAKPRRQVRIACVLDEFSERLFAPEFEMIVVTPANWREIAREKPDLLFVESIWQGHLGSWRYTVAKEEGPTSQFVEMVDGFKSEAIPTVFWNKEDPPNYERFIGAARLFDWVFTVAEEKIPDYKRDLGHDRVAVLPFSAQPALHNPVRSYVTTDGDEFTTSRTRDIVFAGTYFAHKHPSRREQMEYVLRPALEHGLNIYSRQEPEFRRRNPQHEWPHEYQTAIVGSLPYEKAIVAQKCYKIAANVNSVADSESMCSRRVFELLAAGTPLVTGPSSAARRLFEGIVVEVGNPDEAHDAYRSLLRSPELRDRLGVLGTRAVMRSHTASHRVSNVLSVVGLEDSADPRTSPLATLVIPTRRPESIDAILANVARQTYPEIEIVLVTHGFDVDEVETRSRFLDVGISSFLTTSVEETEPLGTLMDAGFQMSSGRFLGKMDDDDLYGPEYLADQIDALGYSGADLVGKKTHYRYMASNDTTMLTFPGWENRFTDRVHGGTILGRSDAILSEAWGRKRRGSDSEYLQALVAAGAQIYSTFRHNFIYMRYDTDTHHTFEQEELELLAKGEVVYFGINESHVFV